LFVDEAIFPDVMMFSQYKARTLRQDFSLQDPVGFRVLLLWNLEYHHAHNFGQEENAIALHVLLFCQHQAALINSLYRPGQRFLRIICGLVHGILNKQERLGAEASCTGFIA
jgi:hypothetical protein